MSEGAPFLRVVTANDETIEDFTMQDIARLRASVGHLKRLIDDPVALIERAKRLLEGTAPKLFGVMPIPDLIVALARLDIPGPVDDLARLVVAGGLLALPGILN